MKAWTNFVKLADKKNTPNELIHESSPYLLQHAYNPVRWLPYGEEAFKQAKEKDLPMLISIGYSACHWCHVMEHESFEDDELAKLMNDNFVSVKVDREERSDVDMVYMQAVQLMTGQGGWPLNCFVMPDGKPFYGGTYFNPRQWKNVLNSIKELWESQPEKVKEYAENLTAGMHQSEQLVSSRISEKGINRDIVKSAVDKWKTRFDNELGGPNRAPKFPLPNNYLFLLRYALLENDLEVLDHVHLTLQKMACGGIYDQLRGGFARYSTDMEWKVPHFEKMLYDNAQLVSLYCEAFQQSGNNLCKQVVKETLAFISSEWFHSEGFFYSAFDADSEGEEGKYYVWSKEDLSELLKENFDLFAEVYHIDEVGYWEHGNYILMRNARFSEIAVKHSMSPESLEQKVQECKKILVAAAAQRIKPGLDDKSILSWNAMMCSAYCRAWMVLGDEEYRQIATKAMRFITEKMMKDDESLWHTYKNGVSRIPAFLDDYAFVTEALIQVYLITQNEAYLEKAKVLTEKCLNDFKNPESELLFYTSSSSVQLVSRNTEVSDNVIPASNSQIALNLFYLGNYFGRPDYIERAAKMLQYVQEELKHYGSAYSNWGCLALHLAWPFRQVAIVGKDVDEKLHALHQHSFTNTILAVSRKNSDLPLTARRFSEGKNLVYVCRENTCKLPVESIEEALKQF